VQDERKRRSRGSSVSKATMAIRITVIGGN